MKNQNDTGFPDGKGADTNYEAADAPASATGIFQQSRIPPRQPEFDDRNADFRETPRGGMPDSRESPVGDAFHSPAKVPHPVEEENSSPGEFTRLFQAITPAQTIAPSASSQASAPSQTPPSSAGEPNVGEFTRIFMRLPKAPEAEPPSELPAVADGQQASANFQNLEAGEFTRMMRSAGPRTESLKSDLDNHQVPTVVPPARSSIPVRGFSAPGASDAVAGTAGVTGPLAASIHKPASSPPLARVNPLNQSGWASGHAGGAFESGSLPQPSAGEFTQLFRALDSSGKASVSTPGIEDPSSAAAPSIGETPYPAAGEFTQLMQSLSPEPSGGNVAGISAQPWSHISATPSSLASPPREPAPASFTGPGDDTASFTRIISSSQAREEAGRELKSTADAQPTGAPPAKKGASAFPSAPTTAAPRPLQAMPILRTPSFGQPAAADAPTPPAHPAPSIGSQGRLQAYLPLLLIVNAFALAVLIVLVVFALRHH
jgi:hypothetical protein